MRALLTVGDDNGWGSLVRVAPADDILDLPSKGDTCFPASLTTADPGEVVIYDYSSDVDGPDIAWREGQRGPTFIYRHTLRFSPR